MVINPVPYKEGYRTSEFWLNAGKLVLFAFVMLGVVPNEDLDGLTKLVAAAATAAPAAIGIVEYTRQRVEYKLGSQDIHEKARLEARKVEAAK